MRTLAIFVGGGVLLAMLGFGLFRSDPTWYRRIQLTDAQQVAGQQRLLDRLATLRNEVGRQQVNAHVTTAPTSSTFDIELTEDEVNGVVMRWSKTEPNLRAMLNLIDEPHVRFLSDRVEFAGRYNGTIASFELSVAQTEAGPRVQLGRPWAGRLPLSRSLLEKPGEDLVNSLRKSGTGAPKPMVDALAALINGDEVAPIVPLPSSLQGSGVLAAKVEKLTVEGGVLKATLRPVE